MASGAAVVVRAAALVTIVALAYVGTVQAADEDGRGGLTPNQLTDGRSLTRDEALAACGPAAAVAFSRFKGRYISLDEAVAVAREVGWTPRRGMAGPGSMIALLRRLKIDAVLEEGVDRDKLIRELRAGRPVIVRTIANDGHYLVAERYDPATGRFDFGQSALVLKPANGRRWYALHEIGELGVGPATHAIYLAAPAARPVAAMSAGTSPLAPGPARAASAAAGPAISADGMGARLRAEPSTDAAILVTLPDGTRVRDLGQETRIEGRTWRRVSTAAGTTGWIDASLLAR